jgi:hypothetical protein
MFLRKVLYWSNFTVIRWQLIFSVAAIITCYYFVRKNYGLGDDADSYLWHALYLFLQIVVGAIYGLFAFSFLTAIVGWSYFMYCVKQKKIGIQTQFGDGEKAEAGFVPVTISLVGAHRPFLGSVRARLVFSGMKMSDPVILDESVRKKKSLFKSGIRGTGRTMLHDRGIYDVQEVQLQFCDMFRLIALPFTIHLSKQLYTLPQEQKETDLKASPNTTEEQTQRIEIPKRVEGEYINYKDFETGDDVRRIVWKIYARSGQLVVRIPETMDPYASHLYFYSSFYNGISDSSQGVFETELLNCYKDKVRNLFEALQKNGFEVRIPHDQEVAKLSGMSDKKNDLFHIAAANWQKNKTPSAFVVNSKAAFVCLSSLTPVAEVAQLIGNLPMNVPVVVVKLSDAIISPFRIKIKSVFFVPEENATDDLRKPWVISPLRSRLQNNEREIFRMLQRRGNSWMISANEK